MKKLVLLLILLPVCVYATQVRIIKHAEVFDTTASAAILAVGGSVTKSTELSLTITEVPSTNNLLMPTRGYISITGDTKCDHNLMTVYVIGTLLGDESVQYLDTLDIDIGVDASGSGEFSFTLSEGTGIVEKVIFGFEPESESADDSIYFFTRVNLEYSTSPVINNTVSISASITSDVADSLATDDGNWDADLWLDSNGEIDTTAINDTQWKAYIGNWESATTDSATVKGWNFMNEDSVMYATQTDIADMTVNDDTTGWNATITMLNDSSAALRAAISGGGLVWADTLGELATDTDLLIKSDSTWVTAYIDSSEVVFWADSANELATNYDLSLKQAYADTGTWDATRTWSQGENILLNQIGDPGASKTFNMSNKTLVWSFTTPSGGVEYNMAGAFSGDAVHMHQHTGNPGAGANLLYLEADDVDVVPFVSVSANDTNAVFTAGKLFADSASIGVLYEGVNPVQVDDDTTAWDATITMLNDSSAAIRGDIPDISGYTEDTDSTAWLATKTNIYDWVDSSEVVFWADSANELATAYDLSLVGGGDYLDPADSAGVAYRDWVSGLDYLDPADSADVAYRTWVSGAYQPLEATLTDIADGTIIENLVNTNAPWADDEIASSAAWHAILDSSTIITWPDSANELATNYDVSLKMDATEDFLDPADSADVAYRTWVSALDFLDPADSAGVAYRDWVSSLDYLDPADSAGTAYRDWVTGYVDTSEVVFWPDSANELATHYDVSLKMDASSDFLDPADSADVAYRTWVTATYAPLDDPTFTTGITVPANSISDEEIDEAGNFNWTGAHVFTGDVDLSASTPDADGEVQSTGGDFYMHDGTSNLRLASLYKQLTIPIDNPKHLTHDSTFVWVNRTGHTFTIDSVYSIARQDDYDYDLVESSALGGTVTLIESITVSDNGTGWFTNSVTSIDHAAIQTGMGILFVQSADSTDCITSTIYGSFTD